VEASNFQNDFSHSLTVLCFIKVEYLRQGTVQRQRKGDRLAMTNLNPPLTLTLSLEGRGEGEGDKLFLHP